MPGQRRRHGNSSEAAGAAACPRASRRWPGWPVAGLATAMVLSTPATPALAQAAAPGQVSASASLTGIGQLDARLDQGGNFSWNGAIVQAEATQQFTPEFSAGVALRYGYENWQFAAPSALGAVAPWGRVNRPAVGFRLAERISPQVSVFVAPELEWSYESGASASDAKNFGAVLGATEFFSPTLVLGLGAGVFRQIDKTRAFPLLIVNWQIDANWRVSNPFQAGPAGGAGLELVRALGPQWELAAGASVRDYRFRLRADGPAPEGIGRNQGVPVFARLTRQLGQQGRIDLYAGAVSAGKLRVLDAAGVTLSSSNYRPAPLLALSATLHF
jgi:hypothetical protein